MAKVSISYKGVACIYAVLSPSNKIYIGQTNDLYSRYKSGVSKSQRFLYRSYKKYGEDNHKLFTIIIFKGAFTQQDLDYWERYYIEVYKAEGYQLLNIREGGGNQGKLSEVTKKLIGVKSKKWVEDNPEKAKERTMNATKSNIGKKRSEDTKRLMSQSASGKQRTEEHRKNLSEAKKGKPSSFKGKTFSEESKRKLSESKKGIGNVPILQFSLSGDLIKEWPSIKEAADTLNLPTGTIGGCIRKAKHYKTCGGFIWRYKSDNSPIIPDDHRQTYKPKECPVTQLDIHGVIINEFNSVKEAASVTGINRVSIIMTCRGRLKSAGGFIWQYK